MRNVERALRDNTAAGNDRLTFGHPRWSLATKGEVKELAGMTLDDTMDAPASGFLPGSTFRVRGPDHAGESPLEIEGV